MKTAMVLKRVFEKGYIKFELPADEAARGAIAQVLTKCRDQNNDYVMVELSEPRKHRTTGAHSQNHHLNGHIMQICNATKNSYNAVKNEIKRIATEEMGYPYEEINGHIHPIGESESSTDECAKLIEAAHLLAADLGLILKETEQ